MTRSFVFSLVLVCVLVNGAFAGVPNVFFWYEATAVNAESSVASQGAMGGDLILACDTSSGPATCEWDIKMQMFWDTSPNPVDSVVGSVGTDLLGDTNVHSMTNFLVGDYPFDGANFTEINAGGTLVDVKAVNVPVIGSPPMFDPVTPGVYGVFTARLTSNVSPGLDVSDGIDNIVNGLLTTLTYDGSGDPAIVQIGDATPIEGALLGATAEDVIQFKNIPEPTTLSLAVLGMSILLRRRRAAAY